MDFYHPLSESLRTALLMLEEQGLVKDINITSDNDLDCISAIYQVPIPQYPGEAIQGEEYVVFEALSTDIIPRPYFREDFPRLPHLLRNTGVRKSPCLYTTHPEQIALQWNAFDYAWRILEWLEKAADGTLHEKGQPLEDIMLIDGGKCIVPTTFFLEGFFHEHVEEHIINKDTSIFILRQGEAPNNGEYKVVDIDIGEVPHSAIVAAPNILSELAEVVSSGANNISLENILDGIFDEIELYEKKFFFIIRAKIIDQNINTTNDAFYVFISKENIGHVGKEIGVVDVNPVTNFRGFLIGEKVTRDSLQSIPVFGLTTHHSFDIVIARSANGKRLDVDPPKVLQVGVGAIGSQIARNLTQSGYALRWCCMDKDILLPHNLSRYILPKLPDAIGQSKTLVISDILNALAGKKDYAEALHLPIPFGQMDNEFISRINEKIDVLIDSSASVSVQRTLDTCVGNTKRKFTVFLAPNGKSIFLFSTTPKSQLTHTMLEVYSYATLIKNDELNTILEVEQEGYTYSGDSCRSISARLSTHYVSMFSAIASSFIEENSDSNTDKALLLRLKGNEIIETILPTKPFLRYGDFDGKGVFIALSLIDEISKMRVEALPDETGGVLLGTHDPITNAIYIVAHLPAPIDSTASPQHFHRGVDGINEQLAEIEHITHKNLTYVGEWHSHPKGVKPLPSETDEKLLDWLRKESKHLTYPFLMLIQGDEDFTILA